MQTPKTFIGANALFGILFLFGLGSALSVAEAQTKIPSEKACKENPPKDTVTQGACIATDRTKGNCQACHMIPGMPAYGDVAPPLMGLKARFDKVKLRVQVADATVANPKSVMPPFGRHKILSDEELDKVIEFLLTL